MTPSHDPTHPIEWLCACLTIPTRLFDPSHQAEPLQSLVWMIPNGPVLGSLTLEPGQAPRDVIVEHFREISRNPLAGEPHEPKCIRIASEELADVLRTTLVTSIDVVCAPTPEFDLLLEGMTEFVRQRRPGTPSHLGVGVTSNMMAAFFRAAANLYVARPWACLPPDVPLLVDREALSLQGKSLCSPTADGSNQSLVDVAALSLQGAALIVLGQGNREFGFLLFAAQQDFEGFLRAARAARTSVRAPMPLLALDYVRGADVPTELRKEATAHGWQVAHLNAYPSLIIPDSGLAERPASPAQVLQAEAISLALAGFARDRHQARDANQPPPATAQVTVDTHAGPVSIKLALANAQPAQPSARKQKARSRTKWKGSRRN